MRQDCQEGVHHPVYVPQVTAVPEEKCHGEPEHRRAGTRRRRNARQCWTLSVWARWSESASRCRCLCPVLRLRPEQECSTITEKQCITVVEKQCNTITEKECTTITKKECNKHGNCWDEPKQKCWDEPRTVCSAEVPHEKWMGPVATGRPRQFLDFQTQEQVRVLRSADLPPPGHQGGVRHRAAAPVQDGDAAKVLHPGGARYHPGAAGAVLRSR